MTQTTTQPTAPTTAPLLADEAVAAVPTGRPAPGGALGEAAVAGRAVRSPRGTAAGTGPRPTPLVVPGVPAAVSAAELAAIAGSTAAYAGGVPGLLAAGAIAGTTAAVATLRRARARRTARRTGVAGTRVGGRGSRRAGGTGRQGGLMGRARAAMAARRQRSARGTASASGTRRTPPGARAAAAHAQRAGRGTKPVTRTVPPGGRATTGTGSTSGRRGPLGRLLGQSRTGGSRSAAGRVGSRGLFGRKRTGTAGSRTAGSHGSRGRASRASGSRSATGGNGVGSHGARRATNPIRTAWREAANRRKALRYNARQAHRDAETARGRHRMVRQIITDAPTPRHARSATYRMVFARTRGSGERPVPPSPLRAVSAAGWATGAWVAAAGYTAWLQHWQTQQQLALGVATGHRGYVVSERVRTAPAPVSDSEPVLASPPTANPVIVRPPAWRSGTGRAVFGTSGSTTPAPVGSSIPTSGGIAVSRFTLSDLAMEQAARAARYTPDSMAYFGADLAQWPEAIGHLALALSTFVKKGTAEYPVHPQVMEKLAEVYKALGTAAAAANEVPGLFTRAHSIDLSRHQAPRRGEHLWNVNR